MTEHDALILDLAGRLPRVFGVAETVVARETGLSMTRFWQRVNQLIDDPEALAADPVLVNRLRRIRETRARARQAVRLAG